MYGYKCDKCGALMYIDPGEERVCDECLAKMQAREWPPKIVYRHRKKEVCHAS